MWAVLIDLISAWEINLDLIPVQDETEFVVWIDKNDFVSVWWVGIDLVFA